MSALVRWTGGPKEYAGRTSTGNVTLRATGSGWRYEIRLGQYSYTSGLPTMQPALARARVESKVAELERSRGGKR